MAELTPTPSPPAPSAASHTAAMHAADLAPGAERCPFMPTYGPPKVLFVRGEGTQLWDADGRRYLDFLCGLAVTSLGHAHPAVADALTEQSRRLLHVSNLFGTEHAGPLAGALDRLLGGGGQVFFANSGAESVEAAVKLARRWGGPGRHGVVCAYGSFHGRTMGALAATGQPTKQEPFEPMLAGFAHVAYGDVDAVAAAVDETTAAVLVEPILGEGGVIVPPDGYLAALRELCDRRGLLLIIDEVQTGLGRTGDWFAHQHEGIRPDVVCLAKALGNGVPIGACWARAEVAAAFRPGDHGSTFGGGPLATAAARAVVATLEALDAPALARAAGARLADGLRALPGVTGVRGRGLLLAAELDDVPSAAAAAAALDAGLVVNAVTPTALRLAPPLTVSDAEVDEALAVLGRVLADLVSGGTGGAP